MGSKHVAPGGMEPFGLTIVEKREIWKISRGIYDDPIAHLRLGWRPWEEKEYQTKLIPYLEKALECSPRSKWHEGLYWLKLSYSYRLDRRYAEAVRAAEKAYEIRPLDRRCPFNLARAYFVLTNAAFEGEQQIAERRRELWDAMARLQGPVVAGAFLDGLVIDPGASQRALDELGLTVEEAGAKARAFFQETLTHELDEFPFLWDERNIVQLHLMVIRQQFDVDSLVACRALGKHVDSWNAVIPGMAEKVKNVEYDALGAFFQTVRREIPGVSIKRKHLALALAQPARSFSLVQKKLGLGATLTMAVRIARIGDYLYVEWHLFERGRLTARIEYYVGTGFVGAGLLTLFLVGGGPILIAGGGLILIAIGGAIIWHAQRTPKLPLTGTRRDESGAFREIVHSSLRDALISVGITEDTIKELPVRAKQICL